MNFLVSSSSFHAAKGVALIRIIIGALMIYHGVEVFNTELMKSYSEWQTFHANTARLMVYAGKSAELAAGIMLLLGLLTRIGSIILIVTLAYVTFFIGHGKFWYEDQHPFLFVLFGILFLFTGPGAWSLDERIFKRK